MKDLVFANPGFLYGLLVLIPMIIWYILKDEKSHTSMQVSSLRAFNKQPVSFKNILRHVVFGLRMVIIALLIITLARPQTTNNWEDSKTEGIDIVIALDVSSSMLARDFEPNRFEASKDVAVEFISGRDNDRIGLVVFSGESFTQCPLTTDRAVLINLFKEVKQGLIEDGTAIGMGLATAINRIKDSEAKSKIIILLTDGVNNAGSIDPVTAANIAKSLEIRVYTIGVGRNGYAPFPVSTIFGTVQYQNMEVKIDENMLQEISRLTDGKYFRATNNQKLIDIYKEIDKLEKSKIEVKKFSSKNEEFFPLVIILALLLIIDIVIRNTVLRTIP